MTAKYTPTHAHTQRARADWYHHTRQAKHRDHLRTTNRKADIISEFLLLLGSDPPVYYKERKGMKRNMMGWGWGLGGSCQHRVRLLPRSQDTKRSLPALPPSVALSFSLRERERGENLIIELLKISLLAETHLHVWEQRSRSPTWGRPFCAWCDPPCHSPPPQKWPDETSGSTRSVARSCIRLDSSGGSQSWENYK